MKHQNEVDNDKQNRKKLKRFGMSIINQSTAVGWEDAEIARLILLVTSELCIRGKKIIKFLYKTSAFSSHIIACLLDEGLSIKPIKVLRYMSRITDCEGFLGILAEGFDCDLYDIENEELLAYLKEYFQNNFTTEQKTRFLYIISNSSFVRSMKKLGIVLNYFCAELDSSFAANLIVSVVSNDFIYDLSGHFRHFIAEFTDIRDVVEKRCKEVLMINEKGKVVESDEDEDGNLKGFVVDENENDTGSCSSNEENEESDSDKSSFAESDRSSSDDSPCPQSNYDQGEKSSSSNAPRSRKRLIVDSDSSD